MRGRRASFSAVLCLVAGTGAGDAGAATISGELKTWHRVTIDVTGPATAETATPNPFTDYRLDVTFTAPSGRELLVPGFYAADGDAANTGADAGPVWRVRLAPDEVGSWSYAVSFRTGPDVAIADDPGAGTSAGFEDGATGRFTVGPTDKVPPDLRGRGQLRYVGASHLRFAETGEWFLKYGADSPENFLAYDGFDNTPAAGNKGVEHAYAPHAGDWSPGDPTWTQRDGTAGTFGQSIVGAVNFLADVGANAISMLLYNANGDGDRVHPYVNPSDRRRLDCSKLAQWEIVLDHATARGLYLHFKLSETENDQDHDGGTLGDERRLYYREMIARFGHHLALNWNISEEISLTESQTRDALTYFMDHDPYGHHRVFHTFPGQKNRYLPFIGGPELTGASLQISGAGTCCAVFDETLEWVASAAAGRFPWIVANDEQGPAGSGVVVGDGGRRHTLWGNLMAGGAGVEYYCGNNGFECDQALEDYGYYGDLWTWSRYAIHDFFVGMGVPFWNMVNRDDLISAADGWCLAGPSDAGVPVYAIYLRHGGTTDLTLPDAAVQAVSWFDPRRGGVLQTGSVATVVGPGPVALGVPPAEPSADWAILVTRRFGDVTGDGLVNVDDIVAVVLAWGGCDLPDGCPEDVDGSGVVDIDDLVAVVLAFD